ncbi:epidermal growth factor receptor substrate 15-like 1 [Prunus yedoensis var. nudiflora]|uniref:Epidermal growth factor receptor substrate 15-like 1 n=1 Tax=Prunus yedoensis var. nudiflora TaxID=2094558 RepID=A0A314YNL3_PRUYE|nr:epidermal growth factor receptor substrate 15-like 1 [Prunus yedoensis var. nudiflora]
MASAQNQSANVDLFDAYFRRADLDRDGRISGSEAVAFSKPPVSPNRSLRSTCHAQGGAVTPTSSQTLGLRGPQVPPQYNSAAAATATQGGAVTPTSSQNLGSGPQVQSQFNPAAQASATQVGAVTPASSKPLGSGGRKYLQV